MQNDNKLLVFSILAELAGIFQKFHVRVAVQLKNINSVKGELK